MTLENNMDKKLFCISTYGCQMNEEDSEKLSGMLKSQGYERTENKEEDRKSTRLNSSHT